MEPTASGTRAPFWGHPGQVWGVAVTPDGEEIITTGVDGTARVWNRRSGEQRATLTGHTRLVLGVAVTPDGEEIITTGVDGTARVWNRHSGEHRATLTGHTGTVRGVAVTPDGEEIITAGGHGTARVWNRRSGEQRATLTGHTGRVFGVAVTPDGEEIITAGGDGTARVWNRRSGEQRATLTGHTGQVFGVAVTPDGEEIISAGADGSIRVWNRRRGVQVRGSQLGGTTRARPLASVRSDEPTELDLLQWTGDVEMLAALVTSSTTEPPLSVALLGEWGSGKSSFMKQMQVEVSRLADLSRNNLGQSSFAANVRQVSFNAWHYSDDHIWSGLVDHLFRGLADEQPATDSDPAAVRSRRDRLDRDLSQRRVERDRLDTDLRRLSAISQPVGRLAWLGSPKTFVVMAQILVRELADDVRTSWRSLLAWLLAGTAMLGVATASQLLPRWLLAGASASWILVGVGWRRFRAMHRRGTRLVLHERTRLEDRRDKASAAIVTLREELATVHAATRLSLLLEQRQATTGYEHFGGLIGQVHRDLRELDRDLRAARGEWASTWTSEPPPLERVVLYIDDLDRCPPQRVAEVLAAVHLLLALPLFVVVVAVDPRWLVRSLEIHHRDLFRPPEVSDHGSAFDSGTLASPLDYLDKIFQVPFALRPMGDHAGVYLRALLGPSVEARLSGFSRSRTSAAPGGSRVSGWWSLGVLVPNSRGG